MPNMKAAFHIGPGELDVRTVPVPAPSAGDVLVRVRYCGVCGSDKFALMKAPGRDYIPGHELSGVVAGIENGLSYQLATMCSHIP